MREFLIAFGIFAAAGWAQSGSAGQADATAQPDSHGVDGILLQGSFRSRMEVWNWFQPDSGDNKYVFSGNILRLSASKATNKWDWQVEFALPFLLGLPSNAVASGAQAQLGLGATYYVSNSKSQNTAMMFPKQVFFRWKNIADVAGQSLQIGRFDSAEGAEHTPRNATLATVKSGHVNQRLIGPFGYTHVGQSFNGAQYVIDRPANSFTIWTAIPSRGAFSTDGWGFLHIAFGYGAYTHEWGSGRHSAETRAFFIEYYDWRNILKVDNRPLAVRQADTGNIRIDTYGGHTLHAITTRAGTIDLLAWGAFQTGRWGVQRQRASSFVGEAGFQPNILAKLKPWVRGGITLGSGSSDPNGKDHGTFFQMLPTARIFARFPFFNMMNIQDRYGSLILRPSSKLSIFSEYHSLRLNDPHDLWYSGGGAYEPWSFGFAGRDTGGARSLANLYDTQADYSVSKSVSITLYCGYAQGLAAMRAIYPQGKNGQYGFVEFTYRF
jgi:hypothetical protein